MEETQLYTSKYLHWIFKNSNQIEVLWVNYNK